jgi:hypothetical protein
MLHPCSSALYPKTPLEQPTHAAVLNLLFVWYRYGNVSSSSIWYVLAYIETFRGVTTGDRVWQLGFGSGFKCNSAVWKANRCAAVQSGLEYGGSMLHGHFRQTTMALPTRVEPGEPHKL